VSLETEHAALRERVQHLEDRVAVFDCVATHARGSDRHDTELLTSTYHDDAVDEHGITINPGPGYAAWANGVHAASSQAHLHNITTQTCEIDGDTAHAESYVLVTLLAPDGATATVLCGRYLDRLERRRGTWKLATRRATVELAFTADSSMLRSRSFQSLGYLKGTRDHHDLSYTRPLRPESEAPVRW
jgi:hypothetical protein